MSLFLSSRYIASAVTDESNYQPHLFTGGVCVCGGGGGGVLFSSIGAIVTINITTL